MAHEAWMLLAAGLLPAILRATAPILLAALGGLVSDLAGCINVALEGLMLVAAFFAVLVSVQAAHWFPGLAPVFYPWIGCGGGLLAALLMVGLLAVFHLEWGADLIVAGIAINILAAGLTVLLMASVTGDKGSTASLDSPVLPAVHVPGLQDWPVLDLLLNGEQRTGHHVLLYAALLAIPALWWFLRRMRWGVWLRAVGENPLAAAAAGIPVKRMRYLALLLSGVLAGLGGVYLSLGYLSLFQADMTAGRGFLALAAVFVGARAMRGAVVASVLFGASAVLATQLGASRIPPQLIYLLPPLVTLLALAVAGVRRRRAGM
ncbi:ABC transporter permease [Herbaspirillum sp. SJZ099]|uniref:ABC transporter permease n=1 Tax=Herbaspirillum sp. SJZ099 TaxID=2572916 RepID=UPI00119C985F|nr:ABC transporter permease [Herbaspirillum sp. SJZ099]TWC67380.1 nucleoside ABC transporter membrane protein [Herbaspirillum sp. SJZ099]